MSVENMTIGDIHGLLGIISVDREHGRLMSLISGIRLRIVRVHSWSARDHEGTFMFCSGS